MVQAPGSKVGQMTDQYVLVFVCLTFMNELMNIYYIIFLYKILFILNINFTYEYPWTNDLTLYKVNYWSDITVYKVNQCF